MLLGRPRERHARAQGKCGRSFNKLPDTNALAHHPSGCNRFCSPQMEFWLRARELGRAISCRAAALGLARARANKLEGQKQGSQTNKSRRLSPAIVTDDEPAARFLAAGSAQSGPPDLSASAAAAQIKSALGRDKRAQIAGACCSGFGRQTFVDGRERVNHICSARMCDPVWRKLMAARFVFARSLTN